MKKITLIIALISSNLSASEYIIKIDKNHYNNAITLIVSHIH
jgi:hypothetical protein